MSLFLILFSVFLSFLSTCIMSYLALGLEVTFWVAPIGSLVAVIAFLQIVRQKWAYEYAVIALAAGSMGGMVGLSVSFSWPTLYFLHKRIFLSWMDSRFVFAGTIGLLIIAAGCLAIMLAYGLRYYLIKKWDITFPTVRVVQSLLYQEHKSQAVLMMTQGVLASGIWSGVVLFFQASIRGFWLLQVHTIPTLLAMGFVAGHLVAKPLCVGMVMRLIALYGLKNSFFGDAQDDEFMLTFVLGMLFVVIGMSLITLTKKAYCWLHSKKIRSDFLTIRFYVENKNKLLLCLIALVFCSFVLHHWSMSLWQQLYLLVATSIATMIVAYVFGEVGVLDLPNFGSFIIVPFVYLFSVSSESSLIAFVFCTICMGLVINLLFSWKLADLVEVSFSKLICYQLLGFVVAVISIGFIIWWYATVLSLGSNPLFSEQALLQERFITLALYDHRVLLLGMLCAALLYFMHVAELSIVIAGCMMNFSVVGWLVAAGAIAYLLKDREKYYPFCFGIYASHAIWLFAQALLL